MNDHVSHADAPLKIRAGVAAFPLDDDLVVFSEDTQLVIGLNQAAALVFREVQRGTSEAQISQAMVKAGMAGSSDADRWSANTISALRRHGVLAGHDPDPSVSANRVDDGPALTERAARVRPYQTFVPVATKDYRLLGARIRIRFAHAAQVRLVDSVIGHLKAEGDIPPTAQIEIAGLPTDNGRHLRSDIYRDGERLDCAPRLSELAPVIKAEVWQIATNQHDFLFYIHSGVVGTGKGCVLLPGASGSGKSSLTAALCRNGLRYYSDEVALIEPGFTVPPVPLAICVKSTGWQLMAKYYPVLDGLPTHVRGDRKIVRYIPPPDGAQEQPPARVSHIVFPRHSHDATTELTPLARSDAVARLMGDCLALKRHLDQAIVAALVRWIAAIDCYALNFSSLDDAVKLVSDVV